MSISATSSVMEIVSQAIVSHKTVHVFETICTKPLNSCEMQTNINLKLFFKLILSIDLIITTNQHTGRYNSFYLHKTAGRLVGV